MNNTPNNEDAAEKSDTQQVKPEIADRKDRKKKKKQSSWFVWPLKAFLLTLLLSAVFSIISEAIINSVSHIIFIVLVLAGLLTMNILFDIIGLAFASCDIVPFYSMASKKQKGAKQSLALLKKSDIVTSVCADIIGDICGIVSGAAGGGILLKLSFENNVTLFIISIVISSVISAFTVGGKALAKRYAINNSQKIVGRVGRILAIFDFRKR